MFRLSPTTGLNLFKECPRRFWLHFNYKCQNTNSKNLGEVKQNNENKRGGVN